MASISPDHCPHCGAAVPRGANACPECGSDETTGWSPAASTDNLGLPDEEFDYDRFVNEEFGAGRLKPHGLHWFWWAVALFLILLLVFLFR
jgi:hypothetical protein